MIRKFLEASNQYRTHFSHSGNDVEETGATYLESIQKGSRYAKDYITQSLSKLTEQPLASSPRLPAENEAFQELELKEYYHSDKDYSKAIRAVLSAFLQEVGLKVEEPKLTMALDKVKEFIFGILGAKAGRAQASVSETDLTTVLKVVKERIELLETNPYAIPSENLLMYRLLKASLSDRENLSSKNTKMTNDKAEGIAKLFLSTAVKKNVLTAWCLDTESAKPLVAGNHKQKTDVGALLDTSQEINGAEFKGASSRNTCYIQSLAKLCTHEYLLNALLQCQAASNQQTLQKAEVKDRYDFLDQFIHLILATDESNIDSLQKDLSKTAEAANQVNLFHQGSANDQNDPYELLVKMIDLFPGMAESLATVSHETVIELTPQPDQLMANVIESNLSQSAKTLTQELGLNCGLPELDGHSSSQNHAGFDLQSWLNGVFSGPSVDRDYPGKEVALADGGHQRVDAIKTDEYRVLPNRPILLFINRKKIDSDKVIQTPIQLPEQFHFLIQGKPYTAQRGLTFEGTDNQGHYVGYDFNKDAIAESFSSKVTLLLLVPDQD